MINPSNTDSFIMASILGNLNLEFLQKLFSKFLPSKDESEASNDQSISLSDKFASLGAISSNIRNDCIIAQGTSVGEVTPERLRKIAINNTGSVCPPKINANNIQQAEEELNKLINRFPISGKDMKDISLRGQIGIYNFILNYAQNIMQYYSNVGDTSKVQQWLESSNIYNAGDYERGLRPTNQKSIETKIGKLSPQQLIKIINTTPSEIKLPQITQANIGQAEAELTELVNNFPGNKTKLDANLHPEKRARIYKFISDFAKLLSEQYEIGKNKKQSQKLQQVSERYTKPIETILLDREESRGITA